MGPHFDFLCANPPVGGRAWGQLFLATVKPSNPLVTLAEKVFMDNSMAGENEHLLRTSFWQWPTISPDGFAFWEDSERFRETFVYTGPPGSGKSATLAAVLRADRQAKLYDQALVRAFARMKVVGRSKLDRDSKRLIADVRRQARHVPAAEDHTSSRLRPSVFLEYSTPAGAPDHDVDSYRFLGLAIAVYTALRAGLAYWRRATAELRRLLSASAGLPAEPMDLVVLDSSPCGIRRLTAVRVPRAPGSGRTSPVPESSLLAAA
ncbi:hypothetical protein AB0935_31765 [Streptomyces sp. NPDC007027]|uniref:hypothetical protein n=1 Tax=Streptomyces sp. NPDC007027 TaxID=3157086 RepID=UPI003452D821